MGKILLAALFLLIIGGGIAAFIYGERRLDLQWQAHLTLVAARPTWLGHSIS